MNDQDHRQMCERQCLREFFWLEQAQDRQHMASIVRAIECSETEQG